MVIYEVNITVTAEVAHDYRIWLEQHVLDLLILPGFIAAEISEVDDPRTADGATAFVVHYKLQTHAALESYLLDFAPQVRALGEQRFPGQFQISRRVLTMVHERRAPIPEDLE
jgi:hypothetical protein